MNDINLLKDFYRPQKTAKVASSLLAVALAVVLFSYIGIFVPLKEKRELALMVSNFSQVNGEYESLEKKYEELSKRVEELKQKASGITPLISGQRWSRTFALIEQVIPQGIALRSLSYNGDAVVLEGIASDDIEIARFMVLLGGTGLFSNISLKRIYGDQGGQVFLITCKLNSLD
ncbi:Tfp pilus assembly protein PilN [Caldicoprobacter guelmensis]|uniref:PilN domain-containing protein n=1 Tax=Caldicoprobacter guelmensis TaxID=1170224 RepID=UPI00195A847A|nr:PilN domain-containing protein [Caldicoprobacter guelmensis]MBM7581273.1 Tfp pilus assembly protein PilN [Caldicoprobacter guelmensis]